MLLRWSFGLCLLFVGVSHYMTFDSFSLMVSDGFEPIPVFMFLSQIWAFVLPALMIVGGGLLIAGVLMQWGVLASALALMSIGPGMLLKSVVTGFALEEMMPLVTNTFIWIIVLMLVVKGLCCGESCDSKKGGMTMKSVAAAPVAKKAPAKKGKSNLRK